MIRENKPIKMLKDLNLLDRFLFAEVIEDQEFMEIVLEIILGKEIVLKHLPQAEKEKRAFQWSKYVRLDVWAQDIDDIVYDTEVQKRNTNDLPKRSRFYNSIIDSKLLEPGSIDYNDLNDVFIIIISPFDIFGNGLYKYTFNMKCDEDSNVKLNDGVTRIFLNTRGTDTTGASDELIQLLKYFEDTTKFNEQECVSERIFKIQEKVDKVKTSEDVGVKFMNLWEEKLLERRDAYAEGHAEGHAEGIKEVAAKFKADGIPVEVIAKNTGLTVEEIEKL